YFIIERSPDETHYETIGVQQAIQGAAHYDMTDGTAPNGLDYYRIRYSSRTGSSVYSRPIPLSLSGTVDFKFYPNPVDKLFIVRTEHTIDLQVIDAAGAVRLSKRLQAGIQVVDVSFLEKGVYILRVTDKESNRAISQQLLKN
ncbi:MAG TPA: T9SS type A sorting domain-containing protein, partial [Puia sp.]|nr:T9SS type A sorting domain-containing protein [Puia sp.]